MLDRLRRAATRRQRPGLTLERQPDALPKAGLFAEPIRVGSLRPLDPETREDGTRRLTFLVEIRDAEDKRCSDVAVEARVSGPQRSRVVSGTTDLLGRIRFRTAADAGEYHLEITDVGAGGLVWDREAGPTTASTTVD